MDPRKIKELLKLMTAHDVVDMVIEEGDTKIKLSRANPASQIVMQAPAQIAPIASMMPSSSVISAPMESGSQQTQVATKAANLKEIKAPMVGSFYRAPAPNAEPYVEVGTRIKPGDVLCIIEAMKLMNEIKAEVAGEIVEILVENGHSVEYGQPLFLIKA
jgi:acetyl-CoA carboxylase biotin carboxyl carrier protein